MKNLSSKIMILICTILLIVFSMTNCSTSVEGTSPIPPISTDDSIISPSPPPFPDYLILVRPTGRLNVADYDKSRKSTQVDGRGVVVGVIATRKELSSDNRELQVLLSKIAIFLDSRKLPNQTAIVADGLMPFGPFFLSWSPNLLPGVHEARLEFTTNSGKVMNYLWNFVITTAN